MKRSIVNFKWEVDEDFQFPCDKQFYCTGYCGNQGKDEMFSIVVKLIDFDGSSENSTQAEVYALSEDMECNLPQKGEIFFFTSGAKIVASGVTIERSF